MSRLAIDVATRSLICRLRDLLLLADIFSVRMFLIPPHIVN